MADHGINVSRADTAVATPNTATCGIPFVIGTGCAIPGVMASRTIRNERERRATAMLTPFMPCGAKIRHRPVCRRLL